MMASGSLSSCLFCTGKCGNKFSVGEQGKLTKLHDGDDDVVFVSEDSTTGQSRLTVDFIVDNLLKVQSTKWNEQIDLDNGHGSDDSRLLPVCDCCEGIIQKCFGFQWQINRLTTQMEHWRHQLIEQVFKSCSSPNPVDDLRGNPFWKRVRKEASLRMELAKLNSQSEVIIGHSVTADEETLSKKPGPSKSTPFSRLRPEGQNVSPPHTPIVVDEDDVEVVSPPHIPNVINDVDVVNFSPPHIPSVHNEKKPVNLALPPRTPSVHDEVLLTPNAVISPPPPISPSPFSDSDLSLSSSSFLTVTDTDNNTDDDDPPQADIKVFPSNYQTASSDDDEVSILPTPFKPAPEVVTIPEDSESDDDTQASQTPNQSNLIRSPQLSPINVDMDLMVNENELNVSRSPPVPQQPSPLQSTSASAYVSNHVWPPSPSHQLNKTAQLPNKRKLTPSELTEKRFSVQFVSSNRNALVIKCPDCCAFFKDAARFRAHVQGHKAKRGYTSCNLCGWRMKASRIKSHVSLAHSARKSKSVLRSPNRPTVAPAPDQLTYPVSNLLPPLDTSLERVPFVVRKTVPRDTQTFNLSVAERYSNKTIYKCKSCPCFFLSEAEFNSSGHTQLHSGSDGVTCGECGWLIKAQDSRSHEAEFHNNSANVKCLWCAAQFPAVSKFLQHFRDGTCAGPGAT